LNVIMTQYSCKVYPNGEFTIGACPRRLEHSDIAVSRDRYSQDEQWMTKALRSHGIEALLQAFPEGDGLSLSSVPIPPTRKHKGLKGMSSYGRRMIRNTCWLLEKEHGRGRVGFGTLTLPELSEEDYRNVCENWPKLIKNFVKWVKRRLTARSVTPIVGYVTEIQSKRYEKTGRAYPHLHFVYPCRPHASYKWYLSASEIRVAWERQVSAFLSQQYAFNASVNCVVIKKSVGAYLAKYLTKGGDGIQKWLSDGLPEAVISHWWGVTKPARDRIRAGTLRANELAEWLWGAVSYLRESGAIIYLTWVYIPTRLQGERCVGACGLLHEEIVKMLHTGGNLWKTVLHS